MATKTKPTNGKTESWTDDPNRAAKNAEHLEAMETKAPPLGKPIILPKLDIRNIKIRLIGDSELICNRWSEKAKKQIRDKQMQVATEGGREAKDPEKDYQASLYPYPGGGFGFPSIAFKNAAVEACTSLGKQVVTKVAARQAFHVVGEFVKINGEPRMREDMVRVGMGTADIRYRGGFVDWSCEVVVRYNARLLSAEQVVNLFNTAGFAVGVGEWRSERDGQFGQFHVG
jgi:hypothetical protein